MTTHATPAAETVSASSAMVWGFSGSTARRAASAAMETESVPSATEREMDRWHDTFIYSSGVWMVSMSKRRILLLIVSIIGILFLPIIAVGAIAVLFGLFWHPLKRKWRIGLVVLGIAMVLWAFKVSGWLSGIMY